MRKIRTICYDGFQWYLLTKEEAIKAYKEGEEVYRLYEDGSEGLCESLSDFKHHDIFGVEKGFAELFGDIDTDLCYIETEG